MKFCSILLMSFLWTATPALAQTVKTYDFSFGILSQRPDGTRFVLEETTQIPLRQLEVWLDGKPGRVVKFRVIE